MHAPISSFPLDPDQCPFIIWLLPWQPTDQWIVVDGFTSDRRLVCPHLFFEPRDFGADAVSNFTREFKRSILSTSLDDQYDDGDFFRRVVLYVHD